jgi:hypothetical protein
LNYIIGSYPYRYGFVLKKISLPSAVTFLNTLESRKRSSLAMKINKSRSEIYLRDRYPFGTLGPILFVGQITLDNGGTTLIRIGPLSATFLLYIVLYSILSGKDLSFDIVNIACIFGFIYWLYMRFYRNYQKLIKATQTL